MFDQKKYVNEYIKDNYKSVKLRIKLSDAILLNKLDKEKNINKYILDLIRKDIYQNRKYNFINESVELNFEPSITMSDLINKIEDSDILNDYGLYMNYAYAIDAQAKKEVTNHIITESDWRKLLKRYPM